MPNFAGTWKMKSSENFDELLKALGVNAMLRKVAVAAASKPQVEIRQTGENFYIKTSTTVRTTQINFLVGQEFNEETVDGRKCKSLATWETENKMYCRQTLLSGNGPKTYWSRELRGDELILDCSGDVIEKCVDISKGAGFSSDTTKTAGDNFVLKVSEKQITYIVAVVESCEYEIFGADDVVCTRIYVRA